LLHDDMHKRGLCRYAVSIWVSLSPSFVLVYSVKTSKHSLKLFSPSDRPQFQFFHTKPYGSIPTGTAYLELQELSYRKQITCQLCPQYIKSIYRPKYYPVTLKSRLRVTQGHWKRNHRIDHTPLTISRVIWHWILSWPWSVC